MRILSLFILWSSLAFCSARGESLGLDTQICLSSGQEVRDLFRVERDVLSPEEYFDFEEALRSVIFCFSSSDKNASSLVVNDDVLRNMVNKQTPRGIILMGACANLGLSKAGLVETKHEGDREFFSDQNQKALLWIRRYSKKCN